MGHQRRTFLKSAGATVFALAPYRRETRSRKNGVIRRGIYRTVDEEQLSEEEVRDVQRDAVQTYRERCGSDEPVGVGQVKPILDFPVYKFQYMIEPDGESQFWFAGPETKALVQPTTEEVEETTTTEEVVEETTTEEVVEETTTEEVVEETTTEEEVEETTTTEEVVEETTTEEVVEETTTTEEEVETTVPEQVETTTPEPTKTTPEAVETTVGEADPIIVDGVESIGRYMQDLQATSDQSLPSVSELELPTADRVAETTLSTTPAESFAETTTSSESALVARTRQENLEINSPVARGLFTTETKAGTLHSISVLGVDRSVETRKGHFLVQIIQLNPNPDRGWEIQSVETVHDWRAPRTNVVAQRHAPSGSARGPRDRVPTDIGIERPSASWWYSQPDITRLDLTGESIGPTWRWRWNRRDPGRQSITLVVGSAVRTERRVERGDRLGTVRVGATFHQRGGPPVGQCSRPWEDCVKPRFALESRYE